MQFGGREYGQSAMEYLMTYGWSILIIAIVLAALFSLGVFSNSNLGPRAQPNSCRVYRPNGPGTTTNINLEGVCNGELPEYVVHMDGLTNTYLLTTATIPALSQGTLVAWTYVSSAKTASGGGCSPVTCGGTVTSKDGCGPIWYNNAGSTFNPFWDSNGCIPNTNSAFASLSLPTNQWIMIAYTFNSAGYITGYGFTPTQTYTATGTPGASFTTTADTWMIGGWRPISQSSINGTIANAQVYNVPLSQNDLNALYLEGIGGAPAEPQYLVGWWPLNGDTNDYSGNGYNMVASGNVLYTSTWVSTYTTP